MSTAIIKPKWSFATIALMVLGFIVFWPLGLAMLAYIVWGEWFGGSAEQAERFVDKKKDWLREQKYRYAQTSPSSGNAAFDAYREEQLRRLEEERRRLDEEIHEFRDYMRNLRMARDREEFDRFIRERQAAHAPREGTDTGPMHDDSGDFGQRQGY